MEKWLARPNLCGLMFLRKHYCRLRLKRTYQNNYFDPSDAVGGVWVAFFFFFLIAATNQNDTFKATKMSDVTERVFFLFKPSITAEP